jgi:DNA-binding IclR family transcriptional regulator
MKKIVQVLEAVQSGAETTTEIAAITGLPNNSCCAHLHRLKAMGLVEITEKHAVKYSERGHWSHIWKLTKGKKP